MKKQSNPALDALRERNKTNPVRAAMRRVCSKGEPIVEIPTPAALAFRKARRAKKRPYVLIWTRTDGTQARVLYMAPADPIGNETDVRAAMEQREGYAVGPFRTKKAAELCRIGQSTAQSVAQYERLAKEGRKLAP